MKIVCTRFRRGKPSKLILMDSTLTQLKELSKYCGHYVVCDVQVTCNLISCGKFPYDVLGMKITRQPCQLFDHIFWIVYNVLLKCLIFNRKWTQNEPKKPLHCVKNYVKMSSIIVMENIDWTRRATTKKFTKWSDYVRNWC